MPKIQGLNANRYDMSVPPFQQLCKPKTIDGQQTYGSDQKPVGIRDLVVCHIGEERGDLASCVRAIDGDMQYYRGEEGSGSGVSIEEQDGKHENT